MDKKPVTMVTVEEIRRVMTWLAGRTSEAKKRSGRENIAKARAAKAAKREAKEGRA